MRAFGSHPCFDLISDTNVCSCLCLCLFSCLCLSAECHLPGCDDSGQRCGAAGGGGGGDLCGGEKRVARVPPTRRVRQEGKKKGSQKGRKAESRKAGRQEGGKAKKAER